MAIEDKVKRKIAEIGGIDREIENHYSLEDYGFTSLDVAVLIAELEELTDNDKLDEAAPFTEDSLRQITVEKIINLVKEHF